MGKLSWLEREELHLGDGSKDADGALRENAAMAVSVIVDTAAWAALRALEKAAAVIARRFPNAAG